MTRVSICSSWTPPQAGSDASSEARAWIENWRQGKVTYGGSASTEPSFVNPLAGFKWPWQQQNVRLPWRHTVCHNHLTLTGLVAADGMHAMPGAALRQAHIIQMHDRGPDQRRQSQQSSTKLLRPRPRSPRMKPQMRARRGSGSMPGAVAHWRPVSRRTPMWKRSSHC